MSVGFFWTIKTKSSSESMHWSTDGKIVCTASGTMLKKKLKNQFSRRNHCWPKINTLHKYLKTRIEMSEKSHMPCLRNVSAHLPWADSRTGSSCGVSKKADSLPAIITVNNVETHIGFGTTQDSWSYQIIGYPMSGKNVIRTRRFSWKFQLSLQMYRQCSVTWQSELEIKDHNLANWRHRYMISLMTLISLLSILLWYVATLYICFAAKVNIPNRPFWYLTTFYWY